LPRDAIGHSHALIFALWAPPDSSELYVIRTIAVSGALFGLALALSACSQGGDKTDPNDPYSGLDPQIVAWRDAIEAQHPACKAKVEGKGCVDFQVMCKAAQDISPDEKAKGITAQVVAAMTFDAKTPDGGTGKSGSAFALFSKAGGKWTRAEAKPVKMDSCAPL
jgi:hypothetical protein